MINIINKYKPFDYHFEKHLLKQSHDDLFNFMLPNNNVLASNANIDHDILASLKGIYIKELIIYNHHKILNLIQQITNQYLANQNIFILSNLYNYPPVHLLKLIFKFIHPNLTKNDVHNIWFNNLNHISLSKYDLFNVQLAKTIDDYTLIDESKQLKASVGFEKKIELLLKSNQIIFKTQEELTQIQLKQHNKAISTPDFLILSPVYSNNVKINWIDAKNFYGANSKFFRKKIKEQIAKYLLNYGSGCIIFSCGYTKDLQTYFGLDIVLLSFKHIKLLKLKN